MLRAIICNKGGDWWAFMTCRDPVVSLAVNFRIEAHIYTQNQHIWYQREDGGHVPAPDYEVLSDVV